MCAGDEEEWARQCSWHSELLSGLDKVDVSMEQLQQEQEKWTTWGGDWPTTLRATVWIMALLSFFFWQMTWRGQTLVSVSSHDWDGYNPACKRALRRLLSAFYLALCGHRHIIMLSSKCKLCIFPGHSCLYSYSRTERWDGKSCGSGPVPDA